MMKTILPVFFLLAVSMFTKAQSAVEAEIKELEQKIVTAILQNDTIALKQLWASEYLVNNPRNNISPNRNAVIETQKAGMINYSHFERIIEQMQFQKDLVITMGYETFVSRNDIPGAKAGQMYKRRFTNIWMIKEGRWQQVARHASMICQ